jgi:hypothetical protein
MAAPIKPCDADDSPTEVVLVVDGRNAWPAIAALALSVFAGARATSLKMFAVSVIFAGVSVSPV